MSKAFENVKLRMEIIKLWGGDKPFYDCLKKFYDDHRGAYCSIEYDQELQMPIRAVYTFPPIATAYEHTVLMRKIAEANKVKE